MEGVHTQTQRIKSTVEAGLDFLELFRERKLSIKKHKSNYNPGIYESMNDLGLQEFMKIQESRNLRQI